MSEKYLRAFGIYKLTFLGPMVIQRTDKRFQLAGIISWGKENHVFKSCDCLLRNFFQASGVLSQINREFTQEYRSSVIGLIKY